MIESPFQDDENLQNKIKKSTSSIYKRPGPSQGEINDKVHHLIHGNIIVNYYLRMSWLNKHSFLQELIKKINSLDTMTLLLNTLHSSWGKITNYCKATTSLPIVYDLMLNDHNRMLTDAIIEENETEDLTWFENIDDQEQVAYLIALLRLSGGALVRIFFKDLQISYTHRLRALALENDETEEEEVKDVSPAISTVFEYYHNPDDPKHQKCLQQEKKWNQTFIKLKKQVEKNAPKVPKKKYDKKKKKDKKSKKKSKKKKKKKKGKKKKHKDHSLDWIQIMPIMIVKQIFNYLDKKSLNRAKKVNVYWKWAIKDLLKDRKVRKMLDKNNKKLKEASGGNCRLPESVSLDDPKPRISHSERRLLKLQKRGAIIEKLRQISVKATNTDALVINALKNSSDMVPYINDITMFPRVVRTNSPIYKKPKYIVKDYNIICEETEESSDSDKSVDTLTHHSSSSSTTSDN